MTKATDHEREKQLREFRVEADRFKEAEFRALAQRQDRDRTHPTLSKAVTSDQLAELHEWEKDATVLYVTNKRRAIFASIDPDLGAAEQRLRAAEADTAAEYDANPIKKAQELPDVQAARPGNTAPARPTRRFSNPSPFPERSPA